MTPALWLLVALAMVVLAWEEGQINPTRPQ